VNTPVSDDDASLFRQAVADAIPAPRAQRRDPVHAGVSPLPRSTLEDERQALRDSLLLPLPWEEDVETGEALTFLRRGLPKLLLRRLRNGHWVIQDELDLHGLRVLEAKAYLSEFLALCLKRGFRCVRVVHGKGLRSKNREPVLKFKVRNWLMQREEILGFVEARPVAGGGGAVMVLLRAP
jgi:DNA-nicking Smr family endonuclease